MHCQFFNEEERTRASSHFPLLTISSHSTATTGHWKQSTTRVEKKREQQYTQKVVRKKEWTNFIRIERKDKNNLSFSLQEKNRTIWCVLHTLWSLHSHSCWKLRRRWRHDSNRWRLSFLSKLYLMFCVVLFVFFGRFPCLPFYFDDLSLLCLSKGSNGSDAV